MAGNDFLRICQLHTQLDILSLVRDFITQKVWYIVNYDDRTEFDTFFADEYRRANYQFPDLMLGFSAKAAI